MHHLGMIPQNQVKRTLSQPQTLDYVRELLQGNQFLTRSGLADFLCEKLRFFDGRGKKQRGSCLKALREMEAKGCFALPAACHKPGPSSPKRLSEPVALPQGVPEQAGEVHGLRLVLVSSEEHMRIWNEMMIREHPRAAGPLVGRQLRYLIDSQHGWLGGLGFGAAALHLEARDKWIGWNLEQRRAHLDKVVGLSRFLIRPSVRCRNLGSRVLSMAMAALPLDFKKQFGYRPLLVESFADRSRVFGTTYRAANWIRVGRTKGRGRQDRLRERAESVKDIYVYALEKNFRAAMGLAPDAGLGPLRPTDGLDADRWAEKEFGGAPLGDQRLSDRLVNGARAKAEKPGRAFSSVAQGDWPAVKAYYRMIDQPEESAVSMPNILAPHREQTVRRVKGQQTVLCIQDGTDVDYNGLAECKGLGVIGTNQTGALSRGLHLHTTLAVATNGLPLGVLRSECTAPQLKSPDDKRPAGAIPIEEKDTFCWIEALRDIMELAADIPQTQLISVCDRETDFFELFDEQRRNPCVDLLVRAKHNRNISDEPFKLFDALRQAPPEVEIVVQVPRQSARPKRSKQKARPKRPARAARLSVRYLNVTLQSPHYHKDKEPIQVWAIHAWEEDPPPNAEAVEWFLLTTKEITSPEKAMECVRWYCLRWRIEDWHRVLKSGCRIEDMAHNTAECLRRAMAINLVIAWRIMLMTLLGRETPELPAEVLFSNLEIKVLRAYAKKTLESAVAVGRSGDLGGATRRIPGPFQRFASRPPSHVARVRMSSADVRRVSVQR